MELKRRSFLGGMLAAAAAPLVLTNGISRGILMPVRTLQPAPEVWTPEVLGISAYGADYSNIQVSRMGEKHIARAAMRREYMLTLAGLAEPLAQALQRCEPITIKGPCFQGTYLVTGLDACCGAPSEGFTSEVHISEVDPAMAPACYTLDLTHSLRSHA